MDTAQRPPKPGIRDVCVVKREPTWRQEPLTISYVFLDHEPSGSKLVDVYRGAYAEKLVNPRVISPFILQWSAVFNPRFHSAVTRQGSARAGIGDGSRLEFCEEIGLADQTSLTRFWLESVIFLSAVTMSAAIVQSRCSVGTIASKYDRLWQVGQLAQLRLLPGLSAQPIFDQVTELAADGAIPATDRLLMIRRLFEEIVSRLGSRSAVSVRPTMLRTGPIPSTVAARFGFLDDLRDRLGAALRCVVVYGSSVSSDDFADYDLVVVSDNPEQTLRLLAGSSPAWRGKELNLSVYSPTELWDMQQLSGDNLAEYGLCLDGEVEVPSKPVDELLARNLSFGMVRQRQQLGMIGPALRNELRTDGDDRRNLYEYFVKIPANIAKGTFGVTGERVSKESVHRWLRKYCDFHTAEMQTSIRTGNPGDPLAASAVATGKVLRLLNKRFRVVQVGR